MFVQWLLRALGYGITAGSAYVASKKGAELGACVATVGGVLLNKATSTLIPKKQP